MANRWETMEIVIDFILLGSKITVDGDCSHEIKMLAPWKKTYDQPRQHIKKQRHYFANKYPSNPSYGFSSRKNIQYAYESWTLKKAGTRLEICAITIPTLAIKLSRITGWMGGHID